MLVHYNYSYYSNPIPFTASCGIEETQACLSIVRALDVRLGPLRATGSLTIARHDMKGIDIG